MTDSPEENFGAFLRGYQSIRDLSSVERRSIVDLILARNIWYAGTFKLYIESSGEEYYTDQYWNSIINNLKRWSDGRFEQDMRQFF